MKKTYKVALSYAHKDKQIAEIIGTELESIFDKNGFVDMRQREELANAGRLTEQLRDVFERSEYSIILYSENYSKGKYTLVEMEKILEIMEKSEDPHVFIINVNECEPPKGVLSVASYIPLEVPEPLGEGMDIRECISQQVHDIIHNVIKKVMIRQSKAEKKVQGEYSLNVQTVFMDGNEAEWKIDYDWNILGHSYIVGGEDGGKRIKEGKSWEDLWKYVKNDFLLVKKDLEPDILRRIHLNCHLSVAYNLGQIYGDLAKGSGNRNLELSSSNRKGDIKFTLDAERKVNIDAENFDFCEVREGNSKESTDFVCIISIKNNDQGNILETVKCFLEEQGQEYRRIFVFRAKKEIKDANMLENLAEYLRVEIHRRREKCGLFGKFTMHLFPDTAAPLMFVLGARSVIPGEIRLYEFDYKSNSYWLSSKN